MRISTLQQYNININRMQDSQTTIGELQRQIATGKKFHQPSDAPAVAATALRLERDIAALDRYDGNMKIATNRLSLEEEMLESMNDQIDSMYTRVVSVDAAENDANLKVIAGEIRELVESLAGAMNKKDSQGEYIFAGNMGYTQPYVLNSDGRWEYQGDNGQREIQIGATHYIESGDSGQFLFESVEGEIEYGHSGASNVVFPTDLTFDSDTDKETFETWLKDEVKGDLQIKTYPSGAVGSGEYTFELVDTEGTVHHSETLTGPFPETVEFKGADINVSEPLEADYSFPVSPVSMGDVQGITIVDNAEMDAFFEDYGDVTMTLTSAPDQYQLSSSKTGGLIKFGGDDTFYISGGKISVGGLDIDVATPISAGGTTFDLKPPSDTHTVTSISDVTKIEVTNAAAYAEIQRAMEVGNYEKIQFELDGAGGYTAQYVNAAGFVGPALPGVVTYTAGSPHTLEVDGITVSLSDVSRAQTFTLDVRQEKILPDPDVQLAGPTSLVTVDFERKNILNIGLEIAEQLEKGRATPELKEELEELLAQTITDIQAAQDQVNVGITASGARLASLEATEEANLDIKLFTETTLSGIEDADLAEVASNFKLEQTLLQASQQTFATVSRMTLFEYIR